MSRIHLDEQQTQFLSVFKNLTSIVVKQEVEILEAVTGFETANKYRAYDIRGINLFYIAEESECCGRQLCSAGRAHSLHVYDNSVNEILILESPLRPCMGPLCFACCDPFSHQTHVFCCNQEIGFIKESCTFIRYNFDVFRSEDRPIYTIKAPICRWDCCFCDDVFHVYVYDGNTSVGQIRKKFAGLGKELFTDADTFGITFPQNMSVVNKALLFAATFQIDFMFYENNTKARKTATINVN